MNFLFRLALALVLLTTSNARAQTDAASSLTLAERAYQDVDFVTAYEHAQLALRAGTDNVADTVRLYRLLGMTAAALGKAEAKQYFIVALAIEPELRLERQLSPKVRAPYLEAQGFWSTHGTRLKLEAASEASPPKLIIRLSDPAGLVKSIRVRARPNGAQHYESFSLEARARAALDLTFDYGKRGFEYYVDALDASHSPLYELGSELDPVLVQQAAAPSPISAQPAKQAPPRAGRSYVLPAFLAVAGIGSVATGAVFHLRREDRAHEWNSARCEQPGRTRGEQCSAIDSERSTAQRLALGFYAGGGALLAASVISLVVGNSPQHAESAFICDSGFADLGVACSGRF